MQNLVIDIGNSHLKLYRFEDNTLAENGLVMVETFDELIIEIDKTKIKQGIISSVRPFTNEFEKWLNANAGFKILNQDTSLPLHIKYQTQNTLGTDRIAAAIAINALYADENVLKIDFGSCITTDTIIANAFEGGSISPGIRMRFKAMNYYTGKLPMIAFNSDFEIPKMGDSTHNAMVLGVINGVLAEVNFAIQNFKKQYSSHKIVITGGDAYFTKKHLESTIIHQPHLVAIGLNAIYQNILNN